jgi:RecA/RadA recombinase
VFDSLAAMVPQSAYYEMKNGKAVGVKSLEDRNMNDNTALARATSNAFPAFSQHCEELGICAIFLNQMRTDLNVKFGDPRKTTGGNSPAFYFSQRLWLSAAQIKKGTEIIGMEVTGSYKKNKIARPFLETNGFITKAKQAGFVMWDGKQIAKETLARQIETEGETGFKKLMALLPANFEPPVVAEAEGFDEDAEMEIAA